MNWVDARVKLEVAVMKVDNLKELCDWREGFSVNSIHSLLRASATHLNVNVRKELIPKFNLRPV